MSFCKILLVPYRFAWLNRRSACFVGQEGYSLASAVSRWRIVQVQAVN
jgi:hypothetical protein